MRRVNLCLVLLACSLAVSCAGNRETLADAPAATPAFTAPAAAPPEGAAPAAPAAVTTVVDGNELAQRSADTLLCRDLLVLGSNMMRKTCGTAAQWKLYEQREAEAAAETVRRMQQGRQVSSRRR